MKTVLYHNHKIAGIIATAIIFISMSCNKVNDYLNVKRENSDVVPTTIADLQALLDNNDNKMNANYCSASIPATDNIYLTTTVLNAATLVARNSYIWAKDIYEGGPTYDWNNSYAIVEYANVALDGINKINPGPSDVDAYNNVKGSALFYRAINFYNLAQVYCKPYVAATAATDLGIPIRLSSDINIPSVRSTLQATYAQIIGDLQTATALLPATPLFTTRPSKASATALLAKTYLVMGDYANAGIYADKSLSLYNTLLDYNNTSLVSKTSTYHFPSFKVGNPEVTFYATCGATPTTEANGTGNVDTTLLGMYTSNDLRKTLYYSKNKIGLYAFFGGYTASHYIFGGVATNEVYLIRAECYARAGNTTAALSDLNTLLIKRWVTGTFIPYTAISSPDALRQILVERRKELPFTAQIRWEDLRRLNQDPDYAVTVTHIYNGTTYTLPPNNVRYVYPIPDIEIQQYGLQQNPR
jgi:tetratricopeptide (TPR) repeat protein